MNYCAMKFNGVYIENVIEGYYTLNVEGRDHIDLKYKSQDNVYDGERLVDSRLPSRKLTILSFIRANSREEFHDKYDSLKKLINVGMSRIEFDDEPGMYYEGVFVGSSIKKDKSRANTFEISIYCPMPYKYSSSVKEFTAKENESGLLECSVVNNGSLPTSISYEITHNHENGYIGIASEYGAIQLGNIEEVDGETYKQNEVLATFEDLLDQQDDHGTNYMNPAHNMAGTLGTSVEEGETYLVLTSEGSTPQAGKWNGGMRTLTLPADSEGHVGAKNFYSYFRHWFESDKEGQTGVQGIVFLGADNNVICGYKIYKTDVVGNTAFVEFIVNGNVVRKEHFTSIYYDTLNPYDKERGHNCVRKEGNKITMYYGGIYQVVTAPELADVECKKVQISISQYDARGLSDKYVKRNCFRTFTFEKVNVEKWRDVPNRYVAGDVIFVDGETTKVYRNGMNITGDEITGSTYFHAPPGNTKVQFFVSDFCDPKPTITARIREAYL